MDVGRFVVSLSWIYVISVVLVVAITVLGIGTTATRDALAVAGLWFAVAGFGTLVIVIVAVVEASRR